MAKQLSRKEFTNLIMGQELTRDGLLMVLLTKHPDCNIQTDRALRHRLEQLEKSPFAVMEKKRIKGVGAVYKLVSVSPEFFKTNYKDAAACRASKYVHKPAKPRYRSPMHPVELQYCRRRQMIDQALASLQGRASA